MRKRKSASILKSSPKKAATTKKPIYTAPSISPIQSEKAIEKKNKKNENTETKIS